MNKALRFLGYIPVILVTIAGAYLVFHMWRLSEMGRTKPLQRVQAQATATAGGDHH